MKALRQRITIARRGVRQAGELLTALDRPLPAGWRELVQEVADLVKAARQIECSDELARVAQSAESRKAQAEQWVKTLSMPVETDLAGLVSKPHITTTNLISEPSDTVIAFESGSEAGAASAPISKAQGRAGRHGVHGIRRPEQLLELFPRLEQYVTVREPGWADIVDAAGGALRHELGVSASLWARPAA